MKKLFVFIFILLIGGFFVFQSNFLSSNKAITEISEQSPLQSVQNAVSQQEEEVPTQTPSKLTIEKIGVEASVESVGMNSKGEMDVPKNDYNVAWYNLGYRPGEQGSAVMAGHFDTRSGGPAVFYKLAQLQQGDEISVTYPNGQEYTFTVTESSRYPFNNFPLQRVFNTKGQPTLNLITCDGVFDSSARNYSERLVVYAQLKD